MGASCTVRCALTVALVSTAAQARAEDPATAVPAAVASPSFKKPSELKEPPGLVLPPPEPVAPTPAPEPPKLPEIIQAAPVVEVAPPPQPAPPDVPAPPLARPAHPTEGVGPAPSGGEWDWASRGLSSKASSFRSPSGAVPSGRERPGTLVYARGFYDYLNGKLHDVNGVELAADVDIQEGIRGTALFHHELRDKPGDLGRVSLTTALTDDLDLGFVVSAATGVYFLPTTELGAELRGFLPTVQNVQWLLGGTASWWTGSRLSGAAQLGGGLWFADDLFCELREDLFWLDSPKTTLALHSRTSATILSGTHGAALAEMRLSIGDAPAYRENTALLGRPTRLTLDGSVGVRYWVGSSFGLIGTLSGGGQVQRMFRVGFDAAVFMEL